MIGELGDTFTPQGPVTPDVAAAYQAGVVVGAGGQSNLDLSNSTAEEQAAFNAGFNAGSAPVTLAQTSGSSVLPSMPSSSSSTSPAGFHPTTAVLVLGGIGLFLLLDILGGRRR